MRLIDKDAILHDLENGVYPASMTYTLAVDIAKGLIEVASEIDAVPVVRGEWVYAINKGSCMDWHVTAKCSECAWHWFSKEGIGNPGHVFGAFITNGDSKPDETKAFLLENAKSNNSLRFCPNCGAKMEGERRTRNAR